MTERSIVCACGLGYLCVSNDPELTDARTEDVLAAHLALGHEPQEATPDIVAPMALRAQPAGERGE